MSLQDAIQVQGLSHRFKNRAALSSVSFRVERRSIHGFVGPNGAGKTTTLKILATLLRPQSGVVKVCGHDVYDDRKRVRTKIGFMPDHFSLYRQMTVFEYLDFFAAAYGLGVPERNRVIGDILALTDLEQRQHEPIRTLSRGMMQRVNLSRVLVNDPEVLLLDEPASGLDPRSRIELMAILRELRGMAKTIFISSHILSELADLCDSVSIIDRGKIKYSGSIDALLASSDGENPSYRLQVGEDDPRIRGALEGLDGVREVVADGVGIYRVSLSPEAADSNRILRALLELEVAIVSFQSERKHLNQAFLDLTEPGLTE